MKPKESQFLKLQTEIRKLELIIIQLEEIRDSKNVDLSKLNNKIKELHTLVGDLKDKAGIKK